MTKGGPYKVVWKSDGTVVGDREGIEKKALAVSWAVELRKFIAEAIQVLDGKGRCVLSIDPVTR